MNAPLSMLTPADGRTASTEAVTATSSGQSLAIQGLSKQFGETRVLDDIHLVLAPGELVTLLGPSGCGKSTLLRCIAGLCPPDRGALSVGGQDMTTQAPRHRGIGMVFQSYALFPNMSVADNVAFGLRMQRVAREERRRRVDEALSLVELTAQADRFSHQLSGGQCQRVALARALVTRPRLLLLDEPLSALDARIRRYLRDQIRDIQRSLGLTTLFVTHDQEEALVLSDRIVLMQSGRIVQAGSSEALYTRPVDHFAAGFMGHYNRLTPEQAVPLGGDGEHRGVIRPEALYIARVGEPLPIPSGARHGPAVPGRILHYQLLGNVVRYAVQCDGMLLRVDALNRSARTLLSAGDPVTLCADPDELLALP